MSSWSKGPPRAGKDLIPFSRPYTDNRELEAVKRVVRSGWLTQGHEVRQFELEFARSVSAPHACAVSSCTAALHLALRLVGVTRETEVITVSHSFVATGNAIRFLGAKPIFVDIDPDTLNMNPSLLEANISSNTKAILCVHQIGMPCDLTKILEIAARHNLPVVEDAACAVGSKVRVGKKWERIGKPHGDVACFSFHPRKLIATGDGGMITTKNAEWDRILRLWRQHGMSINDLDRHKSNRIVFEQYTELGYNYRMTDLQAALGRAQLKKLPCILKARRRQIETYRKLFAHSPFSTMPAEAPWARGNGQSFGVRLPSAGLQRFIMQELLDQGVSTRRGVMCAHREPAYSDYQETWAIGAGGLAESERAQDECILLPLYHALTTSQQKRIAELLLQAWSKAVVLPENSLKRAA